MIKTFFNRTNIDWTRLAEVLLIISTEQKEMIYINDISSFTYNGHKEFIYFDSYTFDLLVNF